MTSSLIGRHFEISSGLELLKGVRSGTVPAVFVRGEPGIGKSRLLHELTDQAELLGYRVMSGRADVAERDVPYVALRRALGPWLRAEVDPDLTPAATAVERALELQASPRPDGLRQAFESGQKLLRAWGAKRPTLLAIDDLHAADQDTVAVLSLLIRHLEDARCLIVATMRAHAPDLDLELAALVERLTEERVATVIDLEPFDIDDVRAMAARTLGAAPDDELAAALWEASRGNPFYVEEGVRSLQEQSAVTIVDGFAHLSSPAGRITLSAKGSLLHRVFRLGSPARTLARVLTAFHRVTVDRLELLATLTGMDAAELERAFDSLVESQILHYDPDEGFHFRHPIVRDTLYNDLGPAERRRIHQLVATALCRERKVGLPVNLVELANHVAQSANRGDAEAALLLAAAGDESMRSAPQSASAWYGRALDLLPDPHPDRGPLWARRARALFLAGRLQESADAGEAGLRLLGPGPHAARLAAMLAHVLTSLGRFEEALSLADRLIDESEQPSPRLLATRAALLTYLDRIDDARAEGKLALRLAAEDPLARTQALSVLASSANAQGRVKECLTHLDDQFRVAEALSPAARLAALTARATYLGFNGMVAAADETLAAAATIRRDAGGRAFGAILDVAAAITDWHAGRWESALERTRWLDLEPEINADLLALTLGRCLRMTIHVDRGHYTEARALQLDEPPVGSSFAAWASAGLLVALGDLDDAVALLEAAWRQDEAVGRRSAAHLLLHRLASAELARENRRGAKRWTEALMEFADASEAPWARMCSLQAHALVHGDVSSAQEGLALAEAQQMTPEVARFRLLLGRLDVEPDDNLSSALETFRQLGAEPERRQAAAELRSRGLKLPRGRRKASSGPLTDSERELARLVQEGLTNRQIANVVHLSPKTVEVYLSRIFTKTGCGNRLELALAAQEGRLESADD